VRRKCCLRMKRRRKLLINYYFMDIGKKGMHGNSEPGFNQNFRHCDIELLWSSNDPSFLVTEYSLGPLTSVGDDISAMRTEFDSPPNIFYNILFSIISDNACSIVGRNYSQLTDTHSRTESMEN
jgi:hypothetical protein